MNLAFQTKNKYSVRNCKEKFLDKDLYSHYCTARYTRRAVFFNQVINTDKH